MKIVFILCIAFSSSLFSQQDSYSGGRIEGNNLELVKVVDALRAKRIIEALKIKARAISEHVKCLGDDEGHKYTLNKVFKYATEDKTDFVVYVTEHSSQPAIVIGSTQYGSKKLVRKYREIKVYTDANFEEINKVSYFFEVADKGNEVKGSLLDPSLIEGYVLRTDVSIVCGYL